MTLFVYVGGVDVTGSIRLVGGIAELTEAADGEPNECQISIDDPTASMTFQQLAPVIVNETACSQPRCFTGIVTQATQARAVFETGAGRVWTLTITDLNERVHRRVFHAADAKRPAETGTARLTWLLASVGMSGLVWDNGKVMANAWSYDEADYRDQYADDVLASIVTAAAAGRWTTFVYWDPTAPSGHEPSLFYGEVTTTTFDSTLAISNVLSVVNETTVFPPAPDTTAVADAGEIYDGVLVTGPFGRLYRQLASTYATFGVHRDAVYDTIRNNNLTSASLHADSFLAHHAGQVDTISVTVRLPKDKVNLIAAGMRIGVYFSHINGYDNPAYTYTRVTRRTFTFTDGTNEYYDVHLELSTRGVSQTGGGNPGDFPHPPAITGVVQTGCGYALGSAVSLVYPLPVSAGDMLVAWLVTRGDSSTIPPAGWSTVAIVSLEPAGLSHSPAGLFYKIADSGDAGLTSFSFQIGAGTARAKILGWELSGVGAPTASVSVDQGTGTSWSFPSLAAGTGIAIVGVGTGSDGPEPATITPFDHFYVEAGDGFWQTALGADKVTTGAVTFAATFTSGGGTTQHDGVAAFFPSDALTNPPDPAQWVGVNPPEYVVMSGVNGTTVFPFANGSLRVFYDNIDQTAAIVSYNGAAGTFVMAGAPLTGWQVRVEYQGI